MFLISPAGAAEAITITDIKVDVTAENSAAARDKAIVDGQRLAFQKLCEQEQITPPNLSDDKIANLVKGFSVQNEKTSAKRYVATLTYRFRAGPTRTILASAGAQFEPTEKEQSNTFEDVLSQAQNFPDTNVILSSPQGSVVQDLIIPVLDKNNHPILWENPNPWRAAWQRAAQRGAPVMVPPGSIDDIQTLSGAEAVSMHPDRLNDFRMRYQTGTIWIARAAIMQDAGGRKQLNVAYSGLDATGQGPIETFTLQETSLLSTDQLFDSGVAEILKRTNIASLSAPQSSSFAALVPLSGLSEVASAQQRLEATGLFNRITVISVSRSGMRLQLQSRYDVNALRDHLAVQGIRLEQNLQTAEIQILF